MRKPLLFSLLLALAGHAHAVSSIVDARLQERTNAVLSVMGFSVVPDLTSSSLSISNADTGNPSMTMSQLAGGFTVSNSIPLYLEGGAAYSRYDPYFAVTDGTETREVPFKWTSIMLNAGIGWDFPLTDKLKIRPLANFAYGHLESDASAFKYLFENQTGKEIAFINGGRMDAAGFGGSLMLDYEDYKPEREIDIEWRYSYVRLFNYESTADFAAGHSDSISTNLWARWRAPTGLTLMQRPLRYVLEFAHTTYFGSQADVLGFSSLSSAGAGIEFDTSVYDRIVTRVRLVGRYRFGENVSGFSTGLAVSF